MKYLSYTICLFIIIVFLTGCEQTTQVIPTRIPATSTSLPTNTPTPTTTHTPEPTLTPTSTPTITPTPTSTPFPTLTPLPRGFFASFNGGFSFNHPVSWKVDEEGPYWVRMVDPSLNMLIIAAGYPELDESEGAEPESIDTLVEDLGNAWYEGLNTTKGETFLVKLGEDIEAPAKDLTIKTSNGEWVTRFVFITQDFRSYFFVFESPQTSLKAAESIITKLLESTHLFAPQPYGLPKDHNLVLPGYDPETYDLDPATQMSSASDYAGLLFSGLYRLNPDLQIEPDLAETFSINTDGNVYTFTLRANLTFADGSPLTTEDVIYSWERAADPDTESSTARTYLGDIQGFIEKLEGKADSISGLKAIDDRTLVVALTGPKPYFLAKLTYPTTFIVDRNNVKGNDWVFKANSSGPYQIKEYKETEVMIFERNPLYHSPTAIQFVTFIIDPGGSWIGRYEDGTLDLLSLSNEVAERVRDEKDQFHQDWQSVTSMCTNLILMNNTIPPFDDPLVRKAFALALDRDTYVERLSNNLDIPALTILPPGLPGFSEENTALIFNAEAAKEVLKESKYAGNLPKIILEAAGFATEGSEAVDAVVDMWRKSLGVSVKVSYLDPEKFSEAAVKEQGQLVFYSWCADYPDPQNFLEILFQTGSEFNASGYSNAQVDTRLDRAAVEQDPAARLALYQEIEKMLLDDFAAIPLRHYVFDLLIRPRLKGFVISPIVDYYLAWLSLEPTSP